jgi:hypothetical protein
MVASVLLTAVLGGQRYLYCRAMNEVMTRANCACACSHTPDDGTTSVTSDNACVEARELGRLVSFSLVEGLTIPPAAVLAVLPAPAPQPVLSDSRATGASHPIRAGPFFPTSSRSHLMVFLT